MHFFKVMGNLVRPGVPLARRPDLVRQPARLPSTPPGVPCSLGPFQGKAQVSVPCKAFHPIGIHQSPQPQNNFDVDFPRCLVPVGEPLVPSGAVVLTQGGCFHFCESLVYFIKIFFSLRGAQQGQGPQVGVEVRGLRRPQGQRVHATHPSEQPQVVEQHGAQGPAGVRQARGGGVQLAPLVRGGDNEDAHVAPLRLLHGGHVVQGRVAPKVVLVQVDVREFPTADGVEDHRGLGVGGEANVSNCAGLHQRLEPLHVLDRPATLLCGVDAVD
mmetsp:Transcript_52509/g.76730  ORF Transcript_52509/g.76730 Transcript_52509/m.76730 type:complete len:271 (+) Transcript_52509:388-1200(+)